MHIYNNRQVYNDAKAALQKAGITNAASAVCSQSFLRLEVIAATNVTQYKWGVLVNDQSNGQPPRITEKRLNLQDAFYVASIQMLIGLASGTSDTAFPVYSFPNPTIFTTSGAAVALNNFYNGQLTLTVNNDVITPGWDILRHYKAQQTQQTTLGAAPVNEFDGGLSGAFPSEPNWVMIGSKNNNLQAQLPAAIGVLQTTTPANATTVLVIIMRGVLAQNVTVVS